MFKNNVAAVIRQAGIVAEVCDGAIGGGHDRISWFAVFVALKAFDVETFVHLPAIGTHATETAALPGFAGRADEKLFAAVFFEQRVVGGGKVKWLREATARNAEEKWKELHCLHDIG